MIDGCELLTVFSNSEAGQLVLEVVF
jgi:hypothetical protein